MKTTKGLTNGRVCWNDDNTINLSCSFLADRGLHAHTIAKATGLSVGQVYYRCKQLGIRLRDYRNGKGAAVYLIKNYSVKNLNTSGKYTIRKFAKRPPVK